jgi:hypothetical protein
VRVPLHASTPSPRSPTPSPREPKPNPVDKDYFYEIKQIVLKPEKVNPQLEIFRIKGLFDQIIIRRDLAAAMDAQGFTGVAWTELAAFHRP